MSCWVCWTCDACICYAIHVNCLVCHHVINVFHVLLFFCLRFLTVNCYTLKMRDRYVIFCICNWRYVIGMQLFVCVVICQRTHDAITTLSWRQNDVAPSFWRHNDIVIASCVRWVYMIGIQWIYNAVIGQWTPHSSLVRVSYVWPLWI